MAHVGQEAGLLGVGLLQLRGAFADPLLQRGQQLVGAPALVAKGAREHADLVAPLPDRGGGGGGADLAGVRQVLQRPYDGPSRHAQDHQRLQDRSHQAEHEHHRSGACRRPGHRGGRIAQHEVPVRPAQPAEGDQLLAVGTDHHAVLASGAPDQGEELLQPHGARIVRHLALRRAVAGDRPGEGQQGAVATHDEPRGARQGVSHRVREEGRQVDGGAEAAGVAAADVGGCDAGGADAGGGGVLDQPLQRGAAGPAGGVRAWRDEADHLLLREVQARRRRPAIEQQVVRPVRPEHDQPVVRREEVEVVIAAVRRLAERRDDREGADEVARLRLADVASVGDEGAHAVGQPSLRRHLARVILRPAAAGAVGLQREVAVEQAGDLGGPQHRLAARQAVDRRGLQGQKVREAPVQVFGALLHVLRQEGDLAMRQFGLEHRKGRERGRDREDHRRQPDTQQEVA